MRGAVSAGQAQLFDGISGGGLTGPGAMAVFAAPAGTTFTALEHILL
jgi:hypothetical protein